MCGIIGYIGNNKSIDILLQGLKNLEYRGYDSSGVALKDNDDINIIKSVGKIKVLENKIKDLNLNKYNMGIAHTRWATNGKVSLENAHPHKVGKVTVVHNEIIENVEEVKREIDNTKLKSETDTEVVAALIDKYLEKNMITTLTKVEKLLKGSYALGILIEGDNNLYVMKNKSPLVIGVGEKESFFASDITAINQYTNKYIFLDDNEFAIINKDNVEVYKEKNKIDKEIEVINTDLSDKDKKGYKHFMLKEIKEEPYLLKRLISSYINNLDKLPDLSIYDEIHIVGCGSAMYAGEIGKILLEEYANVKVITEVASEYRYKNNIYKGKTLIILISQSGETADTIAVLERAKKEKIETLAIVNVETSTIARKSNMKVLIEAGEEIAVATTKAYILQVAILSLLSLKVAYKKGLITDIEEKINEFVNISNYLENILEKEEDYKKIAKEISNGTDAYFIGRKLDYAMCMEGSLKLKEVSYIHSEAYPSGELKHGTISLIEDNVVVFAIMTDDKLYEKTMSNLLEVKARGAKVISITTKKHKSDNDLELVVDNVSDFTVSLLVVPMLQLIAYYTALYRGCDIDKPKNLAKSVTVE